MKTGYYAPSPRTLQIGLGVVALADQEGLETVTGSITRVPARRAPTRREREVYGRHLIDLTRLALDELAARQADQLALLDLGIEPTYRPSRHACRFCPARSTCPRVWKGGPCSS